LAPFREGADTPPSGPPPSQIQTAPNLVAFDPKLVVPSQTIYFQRNDLLSFNCNTNGNAVVLRVSYRWLTPEGEIKEGRFETLPINITIGFAFPLFEGWLLSFSLQIISAFVPGQWLFTVADIARGSSGGLVAPHSGNIWQGYVNVGSSTGWPGTPAKEMTDGPGIIRSITGTAPAAGAEINEVVPANRRWTLLAFRASLTTSATVANRVVGARLTDGVNTYHLIHLGQNTAAGITIGVTFASGLAPFFDTVGSALISLPAPSQHKAGFAIKTDTFAIQAGDQWSAPQYEVLEWGFWDT